MSPPTSILKGTYGVVARTLCALLALTTWPMAQCAASAGPNQVMIVAVSLNGATALDPVAVLKSSAGAFYLSEEGLQSLRLRVPKSPPVLEGQQRFYPILELDGVTASFDDSTQTLHLTVAGSAFVGGVYDQHYVAPQQLEHAATGGFLNYDVFFQNSAPSSLSALFEAGAFFHDGTLTSRYIAQDLDQHRDAYRLDTQYVRDYPEDTATLVLGDSISDPSAWSRAVYFGGIQWHTNFGTRPDLQAIPLPSISGTAAVPSSVDLYVDNVLRQHQNVDAGPFTLANIPAFSGQGNLMVVVHDALGRQELFSQSYLSSALLLKPGVYDDGFEVGALRDNFGQRVASYGPEFSSLERRYGLDSSDTVEWHLEQSQGLAALGAGWSRALSTWGVLTAGGAGSHDAGTRGVLAYGQFDHQTSLYGVSVKTQWSDAGFRQLGLAPGEAPPKQQTQAQINLAAGSGFALLAGYTRQNNRTEAGVQTLNYGLTWTSRRFGSVFAGLLNSFAPSRSVSANLIWTVPLEAQRFVQLAVSHNNGLHQSSIEYDDAPPAELGWGVRLRRTFDQLGGDDAGLTYRAQSGEYSVTASTTSGRDIVQTEVRGGLALIGGHVIATKWLDQSFALVTVPTDQPIDIYANGTKVGRTDQDGIGFVPNLVAYESNHVMLDSANLPLQMTVDLNTRDVVPRSRSGVLIAFAAQRSDGATAILAYSDGRPIENGAQVTIDGAAKEAGAPAEPLTVALHGQVFFANIQLPARLLVSTREGLCRIDAPAPPSPQTLPDLGTLKCLP